MLDIKVTTWDSSLSLTVHAAITHHLLIFCFVNWNELALNIEKFDIILSWMSNLYLMAVLTGT